MVNFNSFRVGDTRKFKPYVRNGLVKNLKMPVIFNFKKFDQCLYKKQDVEFDGMMQYHDFMKVNGHMYIHICYMALDKF